MIIYELLAFLSFGVFYSPMYVIGWNMFCFSL